MGGLVVLWILLFIAFLSLIVWAVRSRGGRSPKAPRAETPIETAQDRKEAPS